MHTHGSDPYFRKSCIFAVTCMLALCSFVHAQILHAEDVSNALETSIIRYEKGDFGRAIQDLKQVITILERKPEDDSRNTVLYRAHLYLGMSYLGSGKENLAKEAFKKAIRTAPGETLDPEFFSPKVISLYNEMIAQTLAVLSIQSNIKGAEVFWGNSKQGSTPFMRMNLLPGTYHIRIVASGEEILKTVDLEAGKEMTITADFQNFGAMNIISEPADAMVSIDGKPAGMTPLLVDTLSAGEHAISISKEGYHESKKLITIKPQERIEGSFQLTPITFSVSIQSTPDNAEVFWDGKSKGVTPVSFDDATKGVHIVRIVKADHDEVRDSLTVEAPVTEKHYTLKAHTGNMIIKTVPEGAEVILNNKTVGITPMTIPDLPVKQYDLKLKKPGYIEKDVVVSIVKDKTAEINEFLREIDTQPPNILFEPPAKFLKENANTIKAHISDNQFVKEAFVMLKSEGMAYFRRVDMASTGKVKNVYEASVPDLYLKKDSVLEYYLSACDAQNNCVTAGSKESPYKIRVTSLEPYTEGYVLDVSGYEDTVKVTISLGSLDGVQKGDKYIVFRTGKELRDPKTNDLLQIEETFIGTIVVKELLPHTSYARVLKAVRSIARNDRIRKVPSPPSNGSADSDYAEKIVLRWAPNHEPEVEGYRIFRSSTIDGTYKKIEEISGRDTVVYEDTDGMREGLTYYYKISAFNILGNESPMTEPIIGRTKKAGPPPNNIRTEGVRIREVALTWDAIQNDADIRSYVIYRSATEGGEFAEIAQVDSSMGTYTDRKELGDGKTYFYKIASKSRHGSIGTLSEAVQGKTKELPSPPPHIIAVSGLARKVKIQWDTHPDPDVAGYIVSRDSNESGTFTKIGKTTRTEFLDKELADGATYFYTISSYYSVRGDEISGQESPAISARTKQIPMPPVQVNAASGLARKTILTWKKNDEKDIVEYWIYKGRESRLDRDPFAKVPAAEDTLTDTNLMDSKQYSYAVRAVDADGLQSELSDIVSATTKPLPRQPAGIQGKAYQGRILLEWNPNEETDIKGYNIYRKGWLKGALVTFTDKRSIEIPWEEKTKSITLYVTAVDQDGLESAPSEEVKIHTE